ncbi:MAG TPA: hypothetical protein VK203_17280 [Nostocaceae cyanobacterium]|nr:hypothetical protein [Nostocaceae cyanobacterium]
MRSHLHPLLGFFCASTLLITANQAFAQTGSLPPALADKIMQDMAWRSFVPKKEVRITRTEKATFNGCLDVAPLDSACTAIAIPGWKVTIEARKNKWTYHTIPNGKFVVNGLASIDKAITNQVLAIAAWRSDLPISQLRINWVENKTWSNSCSDLPGINNCINAKMPGWQVTVTDGKNQTWLYRTGLSYSVLYNSAASKINKNIAQDFTQGTANTILQDMSKRSGIPVKELQVTKAEPRTFNGCLSIATPETACNEIGLLGWRVIAEGYQQRWVYHVVPGKGLKLNGVESFPRQLLDTLIKDIANFAKVPEANLKTYWIEQKVWNNDCRGLNSINSTPTCKPGFFPGWIVKITDGSQIWTYHTAIFQGGVLHSTVKK